MNDPRFDPALKLYDVIRDIEKNIGEHFAKGASGFTNDLNTHVRDTVRAQVAILRGVADTLNVLSNTMYEAEKGILRIPAIPFSRERKELTTKDYRKNHPEKITTRDYRPSSDELLDKWAKQSGATVPGPHGPKCECRRCEKA